jgi:hypothetical protein
MQVKFRKEYTWKLKIWKSGRGWGQGGEMTQALYAHMNNKTKQNKTKIWKSVKNRHTIPA